MSQSTDGEISYGIVFEEGFEFPWDSNSGEEKEYSDIDDWWMAMCKGPVGEEFEVRWQWKKDNPCPVTLLNYCSGDYPMYALIVPSSLRTANRGEPIAFNPADLVVSEGEKDALLSFCEKYGIEHEDEPSWLLTSYWG